MKKKLIISLSALATAIILFIVIYQIISYLDDQPPLFDQTQIYRIIKDENSCLLRAENISTGKSNWIVSSSNKKTRNFLNKQVFIYGKYIYIKKSMSLLGTYDNCPESQNPPYMLSIYIDKLIEINKN